MNVGDRKPQPEQLQDPQDPRYGPVRDQGPRSVYSRAQGPRCGSGRAQGPRSGSWSFEWQADFLLRIANKLHTRSHF